MKETMTLKNLNDFAKENGLPEDVKLFVFGEQKLLAVTEISTEEPSEDALYTDIYFRVEEEPKTSTQKETILKKKEKDVSDE